jgi:iron complex outermembrane recepter protein
MRFVWTLSGLAACLCAPPAWAQTPAADEAPFGEEIVISGGGDIGVRVGVLDAARLDAIGAQVPSEALNRFPGVNIQRNNGVENLPAIRSPVLTGGQSAGSFLVLEDGVAIRAPGFSNVNQLWEASLDFAASIDVVRGPGGAAYSSTAVHGVVNVLTPPLAVLQRDHFAMREEFGPPVWGDRYPMGRALRVNVGGFGRTRIVGEQAWSFSPFAYDPKDGDERSYVVRADGPGAPRVYLGVSAETDAGWRSNAGLDRQALLLRYEDFWDGWNVDATLAAQNLNQESAGFLEGEDIYKNRAASRANPVPEAFRDGRLIRARATFSQPFFDRFRLQVTPFARAMEADLNLSFFPSRAQEITRQIGAGVLTRMDLSDLNLALGLDIDITRGALIEFQSRPTTGTFTQGLHYDFTVDMATIAAYVEKEWRFGENTKDYRAEYWAILFGARAEWTSYDYDNRAPLTDVGRFRRIPDRIDRFRSLTPKLSLMKRGPLGEAFVTLASGARPPQITDLYALQTTQTPGGQGVETIDSFEAGWRGALAWLDVDISFYHMDKRGTSFRNADGLTVTGAQTRHQGVELSVRTPQWQGFRVSGWTAYARHSYRFSNSSTRLGESIRVGDDVDTAPRWTANWRLAYAPSDVWDAELEWSKTGAYFTNAANTRRYGGHDVFTLRARWRLNDTVELGATVRNLFDARYADRADFAFGQDRYFPGEPRNLTLTLRVTPSSR